MVHETATYPLHSESYRTFAPSWGRGSCTLYLYIYIPGHRSFCIGLLPSRELTPFLKVLISHLSLRSRFLPQDVFVFKAPISSSKIVYLWNSDSHTETSLKVRVSSSKCPWLSRSPNSLFVVPLHLVLTSSSRQPHLWDRDSSLKGAINFEVLFVFWRYHSPWRANSIFEPPLSSRAWFPSRRISWGRSSLLNLPFVSTPWSRHLSLQGPDSVLEAPFPLRSWFLLEENVSSTHRILFL